MNFYPDYIRLENDPAWPAVMPRYLMFRDDTEVVMLQAADMLAGELRLVAEDYPDNPTFIGNLCPDLAVSKNFIEIGEALIEEMHDYLTALAEEEGGLSGAS